MSFNKCKAFIIILMLALPVCIYAQNGILSGTIKAKDGSRADEALLYIRNLQITIKPTDDGSFKTQALPYGHYECVVTAAGMVRKVQKVHLNSSQQELNFLLDNLESEIDPITITSDKLKGLGSRSLSEVDGAGIYAGRKSEVIELKEIVANTANNNPRQIYGRITGLNIWESDGTGMQLGIGGRGLSPNRTSNFNTRQNGYDISADALGYPESYYTPPAEALERIEIVRGAASLQYGTQFGGLLNFKMKQGPEDEAIEVHARISGGSFGFLNSFNSIGGTVLKGKINYYSFYQRKHGNGWRPNSQFEVNTAYAALSYRPGVRCTLTAEYTHMNYWAQQPGGLTDTYFMDDPRQSVRSRNWFQVNWDLLALVFDYRISERTSLNMRTYTLQASRLSLGNLERINVADFGRNRTLIQGEFNNIGHESRLLNTVKIGKQKHTGILGFRAYKGITYARQGDADNGEGPNFRFLNPGNLENSDYRFPNFNYAIFAEHIFNISDEWSLTPGVRWEFIETQAEGYYKQRVLDAAGNIVADTRLVDSNSRYRDFVLAGLGLSWKPNKRIEWYGNISQNYRAINFTDLRISNPNLVVDPELRDERGFTADLGIKGNRIHRFQYEITAFHIAYQDRIGQVLRADRAPLYLDYRYRTNIADARNMGIEAFGELNILPLFKPETSNQLNIFINAAWIHARYLRSDQPGINGNQVEMVPPWVIRTGLTWKHKDFRTSLQYSFTQTHFSDASNAKRTSTAVEGLIPAYQVVDFSFAYTFKSFTLEGSLNNLLNEMYFTRRAESYPGPGLIPADGRNFTITLQYRFVRPRK